METTFTSIDDLKQGVINSPDLQKALQSDLVGTINNINQAPPLESDMWIYRLVVAALGLSILIIATGILILMGTQTGNTDAKVPTILTAIGSGAIGALSGLLAPSPKKQ